MVRTRQREDQVRDSDFLSEQEGSERFVFKQGQGTNSANVVLESNYYLEADRLQVDGYQRFSSIGAAPTDTLPTNGIYLYNQSGALYTKNSSGDVTELGGGAQAASFSPVIKVGTTTLTTTHAEGYYTKNGDQITVAMSIAFTTSGSGNLTIEGLPVAAKNIANLVQGLNVCEYDGITIGSPIGRTASIQATIQPNGTTLTIQQSSGGSNTTVVDSDMSSSGTIRITGSYISE